MEVADDGLEHWLRRLIPGGRKVAPDDELLATIHAILNPGAASFSRLVMAVFLLPDDPFKPLLAHQIMNAI